MAKKVAVVLSGCGVFDGAEIQETVLTLLYLDQAGLSAQCLAPNRNQHHVINHLSETEVSGTRNMLEEAARIARGDVNALEQAQADAFDAAIFPGGFGAAKNLTDFAFKGRDYQLLPEVASFCQKLLVAHKPLGFMCIAPVMLPKLLNTKVRLTIGNDPAICDILSSLGASHQNCAVDEIAVDQAHHIVTTPAYMLAKSIGEAAKGIETLVAKIRDWLA